ncbi:hypothetical protein FACS189427_06980 [Planctomycetales bacterium]|nr:hypothetical protein FACS189427_06980 [Planctomycetales bacterium]
MKSESYWHGVLVALFFAMTVSVMTAFVMTESATAFTPEGMRLWKPYQPEQFGGQRRDADGFFFGIEGILWKVDGPKGIPAGYRNPDGTTATRSVYTNGQTITQHSSLNTNQLENDFSLGTRIEFGNIRGHHGWMMTGYGFENGSSYEQRNGSIVLHDPEVVNAYAVTWGSGSLDYVWQPDGTFRTVPVNQPAHGLVPTKTLIDQKVGYLWGWHLVTWADPWTEGFLAPVPLNFDRAVIRNTTKIRDIELMYVYRSHPFKWGGMNLYAGARHWNFDDRFSFEGLGNIEAYEEYKDMLMDEISSNDSSSGSNNNNSNDSSGDYRYILGDVNLNELGPLSILADTEIVGRANNRITGPQFGVKLTRRNSRWTFGAEGRFTAGINMQSQRIYGTLGSHFIDPSQVPPYSEGGNTSDSGSSSATGSMGTTEQLRSSGVSPFIPLGLLRNTQSFNIKKNETVFSPVVELRLTAKWQWTDNVGVQCGFNSTIADNIARGSDIIDYSISDDGQLFGFRKSKEAVIVYGFTFGLNMSR